MLNIYKASAGSGKTYTLTGDYLFLSFENSLKFRNILAVTFTNKAAGEMKNRIIEKLFELSVSPENSEYLNDLKNKFGFSTKEIQQKAKINLAKILHNYSFFNISTIDSFVQKVIRSFAFELRAPSSYIVEMDTQKVAEAITDELIQKLADDKELKKWLISFSFEKIQDGKRWDFRDSITDFAKQLFSERFYSVYSSFKFTNDEFISKINELNKKCNDNISNYIKNIKTLQNKGLEILNLSGIKNESGAKVNDLFSYFTKKLDNLDLEVPKRLGEGVFDNNWWSKTTKQDIVSRYENTLNQITDIINEILFYEQNNSKDFFSSKIIKNNIYNFGIINYLYNLLPEYRIKNNALLISDLTLFLKKIIGNEKNDAPFIYEKIGNKFQNIMIDEFQDTSDFQWQNFRPLISDSLANGFDNLIVGDIKQSIYRWRNGDWRLLFSQIKDDLQGNILSEISLDTNWRSKKNIILFNNTIFSILPQILQKSAQTNTNNLELPSDLEEIIPKIYKDVIQNVPEKNNQYGYVEIHFSIESNWKEELENKIISQIDELLENFSAGDIGILVRTNSQANEVMQILLEHNSTIAENKRYNVISSESLLLENSLAIKIIVNALKLIQKPKDLILGIEIATNYLQLNNISVDNHNLYSINEFDELKNFIPNDFINLFPKLSHYSLYELIEKTISIFELNKFQNEIPFIRSFQEHVSGFIQSQNADMAIFLNFWKEKSGSLSVQLSDIKDAVQILTVHKSKGLAFKIVIVPYLDWDLKPKRSLLWTNTKNTPFEEMPFLPMNIQSDMLKSHFANDYIYELFYNYIDTLNVLYVAFTRAKERIYSYAKIYKTTNSSSAYLSSMLYETLKNLNSPNNDLTINPQLYFNAQDNTFIFGDQDFKPSKKVISDENEISSNYELSYYPSHDWTDSIAIIAHSEDFIAETVETRRNAMKYGILMHAVFERLKTQDDIDKVINEMLEKKTINKNDAQEINITIKEIFKNPKMQKWFSADWEVYTEKEILTRFGDTKIPDRVISKDNELIVLEFKFGAKRSEHKRQVKNYMKLLQDIFPGKQISGFLLYFEQNVFEEID